MQQKHAPSGLFNPASIKTTTPSTAISSTSSVALPASALSSGLTLPQSDTIRLTGTLTSSRADTRGVFMMKTSTATGMGAVAGITTLRGAPMAVLIALVVGTSMLKREMKELKEAAAAPAAAAALCLAQPQYQPQ